MKTIKLLVIPAVALIASTSCKSKKAVPIQKETAAVEISVPFSDKKYRSDEDFFRAKQLGKSPDLAASKKIALQNAKSELAGNIQTMIKKVTDQYTNQRTIGNAQEFENKFEELAREVTNQQLASVVILDEKIFKESDGAYTYWVAIEANKKEVFGTLDKKVSSNAALKLDYDKQKFQEVFDAEMKKLAAEQGN
ncbi:MAG: hypothetical protein ACK504_08440 [Bacteroidota bacterium]|jgi:hypothetical protein